MDLITQCLVWVFYQAGRGIGVVLGLLIRTFITTPLFFTRRDPVISRRQQKVLGPFW